MKLGEKLNEEIYRVITKDSILSNISLEEIIDIAVNLDKFWEFSGAYYKINEGTTIIIDREQSVGGYNNSELTLSFTENYIVSNNKEFQSLINELIIAKTNTSKNENTDADTHEFVEAVPGPAIVISREEYKRMQESSNDRETRARIKQNAMEFLKNNIKNKTTTSIKDKTHSSLAIKHNNDNEPSL